MAKTVDLSIFPDPRPESQAREEILSLPSEEAVKRIWNWIEVLSETGRIEQASRLEDIRELDLRIKDLERRVEKGGE